ncbi:hypothetical protein AB5I41_28340 [Sphingomonas sp. MMS24-JH45]
MVLNTASRTRVALAPAVRRIALDRGEAWFQVAHDPARPFVGGGGRHPGRGGRHRLRRAPRRRQRRGDRDRGARARLVAGEPGAFPDHRRGQRATLAERVGATPATPTPAAPRRRWRGGRAEIVLDGVRWATRRRSSHSLQPPPARGGDAAGRAAHGRPLPHRRRRGFRARPPPRSRAGGSRTAAGRTASSNNFSAGAPTEAVVSFIYVNEARFRRAGRQEGIPGYAPSSHRRHDLAHCTGRGLARGRHRPVARLRRRVPARLARHHRLRPAGGHPDPRARGCDPHPAHRRRARADGREPGIAAPDRYVGAAARLVRRAHRGTSPPPR